MTDARQSEMTLTERLVRQYGIDLRSHFDEDLFSLGNSPDSAALRKRQIADQAAMEELVIQMHVRHAIEVDDWRRLRHIIEEIEELFPNRDDLVEPFMTLLVE